MSTTATIGRRNNFLCMPFTVHQILQGRSQKPIALFNESGILVDENHAGLRRSIWLVSIGDWSFEASNTSSLIAIDHFWQPFG